MKAIVLAGGVGIHLRPLSCSRPKELFPIANDLLIDYTLKNLSKNGFESVILSVYYMAESIVRHVGASKFDMGIIYSREPRPLGKGGGIKRAESLLNGDTFVVINGDIITDFEINRLIEYHKEKGGLATIALHQVQDPGRFGSVKLDWDGKITRFVEKPEEGMAPSTLINAGIYVFEPEVLDYMPEGIKFDTEEDIFPKLVQNGELFGFEFHGFWSDIGSPAEYLKTNAAILKQKRAKTQSREGVIIKNPCILGNNVRIGKSTVIGPNVSIMDNVSIGTGCKIENCIIFEGAVIDDFTSLTNAIIGENAVLEKWVKIESESLIGDYSQIGEGVTITQGVSICPNRNIKNSILTKMRVM